MRAIAVLVAIVACAMVGSQLALAEGGGPQSGSVSPEIRAGAAQKAADSRALASPSKRSIASSADLYADSGSVYMPMRQEPQASYANNWCGPGSSTALVGNWRGSGYVDGWCRNGLCGSDAYMQYLAWDLAEVTGAPPNDATSFDNYVRVTNSESCGSTSCFYYAENMGGSQAAFDDRVSWDISLYGHPLAPVVWTSGLPGWNRGLYHFVSVDYYCVSCDSVEYGDSAGYQQSGNSGSYGYHVITLSQLYWNHVITAYDTIVW